VTPKDELRLVDYDGMYCPAFGKGRSPELGHANFQHPRRLPEHYDDSIDNFSAIVIYMSLLALAEDPALWKDFYTVDNLLLTSGDYKNPQNSKAFARLLAIKNPVVKQLAALIKDSSMRSIQDVPWFEDAVVGAEKGTLEAKVAAMPTPAATEGISWMEDSETAAPGAAVSRQSPATRPSPAPAAQKSASAPSRPAPAPSRSTSPTPSSKPMSPSTADQREEDKPGLPVWVWGVVAVVIIGIIVAIVMTRK
jgi:hypothetical protein